MAEVYDLIIIGGGSAGLSAASFAVQLGIKVALIERKLIGGDCLWTGCIPTKTLIRTARALYDMKTADRFGLKPVMPDIDIGNIMSHINRVIWDIYGTETPEELSSSGLDVYLGDAAFASPHNVSVNGHNLFGHHYLVCTGANPVIPKIDGIDSVQFYTHRNIWDIEELPSHLIILGAGPIGCEFAQSFRRLGSRVTLIDIFDRILPTDDISASKLLEKIFRNEGIEIILNSHISEVKHVNGKVKLVTDRESFTGDKLLVTVGRLPNVENLGLERAGIVFSERGIVTDENLHTSQKHIFAAGDCTGGIQYSHYAEWQAFVAARNAFVPGQKSGLSTTVPWTTFTDPEIAHVGMTEAQAREIYGEEVSIHELPIERLDRAKTEGDIAGFIKLVYRTVGEILGVTIASRGAGDMISEWIVAMDRKITVQDIANYIHVYPTYSMVSLEAAKEIRISQMLSGTRGKIIRSYAKTLR
jgi:pyruvate/2-oxoglutarate dehydrogenase complex dihydrolipoamide dehydrogenase (E3) component